MAKLDELLFDLEQLDFRLIQEDQAPGMEGGDLPAELAADAPAGASDQDDAAVEDILDLVEPQVDGFASEQVLDVDGPQPADGQSAGGALVKAGNGEVFEAGILEEGDDFAEAAGRGGGHGNDHLLDAEFGRSAFERLRRADDGDAVDIGTPFVGCIIEEGDGDHAEIGAGKELADEAGADIAGADDGHLALAEAAVVQAGVNALKGEAPGRAHGADGQEPKEALHDNDSLGRGKADVQVSQAVEGKAGTGRGIGQPPDIGQAEVLVDSGELAEDEEAAELEPGDPVPVAVQLDLVSLRHIEIEAELIGEPAAEEEHGGGQEHDEAAAEEGGQSGGRCGE